MTKQRSAREQFESVYQSVQPNIEGEQGIPPSPAPAQAPFSGGPGYISHPISVNDEFSQRGTKKPMISQSQDLLRLKTSEELQLEKEFTKVRETGFLIWKTVIVPPNAYVVHTRKGKKEPITLGLGISFSYNPFTDSYLVVPSAMQTIGIVANCITREKQGINILAYVQWLISDFSIAYKKLDFSDSQNPVAIVNAQLREQAEAAIKDKIATMSVEEVLTDKEPIIEELTTRMKSVAEGRGKDAEGLGLKIVTVQIKEAIVSSQSLWSNLQAPFRNEKEKEAQISRLSADEEIHIRTTANHLNKELRESTTATDIKKFKAEKDTEAYQVELKEEAQRFHSQNDDQRRRIQLQEETTLVRRISERKLKIDEEEALQLAKIADLKRKQEFDQALLAFEEERIAREQKMNELNFNLNKLIHERESALQKSDKISTLELIDLARQSELKFEAEANKVKNSQKEIETGFFREEQEIRNNISQANLTAQVVEQLPVLAKNMPKIDELKTIQISSGDGNGAMDILPVFFAKIIGVAQSFGLKLPDQKSEE